MTPKRLLTGLIVLFSAVLALLFYNTYDRHDAEQIGVGQPAAKQTP